MSQAASHEPMATSAMPTLVETPEELAFEQRAAEASLWTGTRLAIGIGIFAFASLAFAYFFLRSNNNADLWRPHNMTAPTAIGAAVMAFTITAAAMALLSGRRLRANRMTDFQIAGWTVVLASVIAMGLQIWELTQLPFYPSTSGYASCFIGWSGLNIALIVFGMYWTETLLARYLRLRRALAEEGASIHSTLPAARLFRANVEGAMAFWCFIAVVELFFWVLFYLI